MLKDQDSQLSIYSVLYNKIPENHILKRINKAVSLGFVNDILESSYCKYYGRPAKEPELMVRLLILQYLYNLSDERVIEEASLNLAYMWFLGINPDDELPHPSLLAKFRVHRLKDITMDEIITEIVKQCVDKGIIKDTGLSIDATHTEANTTKKVPERIMKHLAKKIFASLKAEGEIPDGINTEIPNYKEIEDHNEAKGLMLSYLEGTIAEVERSVDLDKYHKTKEIINNAKDILADPKFIQQKGVRSLVDKDARVGYKSKNSSFYGYKTEYSVTTESRIITGVRVYDGGYVDGTNFTDLLKLSIEPGLNISDVFGDKAYFRKPILDAIKEIQAKAYIPVSESVYRIDEEKFSYNKDSDQWFCKCGNHTVSKKKSKPKNRREVLIYRFGKESCINCDQREECIKGSAKSRILRIGINTPELYEYSQKAKTKEFIEKYKSRASQEWKNGEIKRFHGLNRARGYGLRSLSMQAKLTALAVNLKRIAALASSFKNDFCLFNYNWRAGDSFLMTIVLKAV